MCMETTMYSACWQIMHEMIPDTERCVQNEVMKSTILGLKDAIDKHCCKINILMRNTCNKPLF